MKRLLRNVDRASSAFSWWAISAAGEKILSIFCMIAMALMVLFLTYQMFNSTKTLLF